MAQGDDRSDGALVADALAEVLLGQRLTLTRKDLTKRTGTATETTAARWRTLGYPEVADDDVAFTKADAESLKAVEKLMQLGLVDPDNEESFIRTIGRTFSRLAEWQVRALLQSVLANETAHLTAKDIRSLNEMLTLGAKVQEHVWRRHLFGAAARLLPQYTAPTDSELACAGFVDIVGFTSRSRSMTGTELAAFVDRFESVASDLIAEHGGRVVKTIGDEVLFVADDPVEAAWLGAELAEQQAHDGSFPKVRVGMAFGEVHNRLGDVLGPVVNMASRLTSAALPGRVMIDPAMADHVKGTSGLRVRRMRRVHVKGFDPVEPWSLRLAQKDRRSGLRGVFEDMLDDAAEDIAMRLPQRSD